MENVRVIEYMGTEVPVTEGLEVEAVLEAMNVPANATKDFNPATGVLHVSTQVGSKGALFDEDEELEDDPEEEFGHETTEGYEQVEPEKQWALPKHTFSRDEIKFIESDDYDVENVESLIQAKQDYKALVLPQAHRDAQSFIDGEITATDLIRKLTVLGL